jgi:hypothetical protein
VIDARVVAAKRAHANHGDVDEVSGCQFSVLGWLVAGGPVDLITKGRRISDQMMPDGRQRFPALDHRVRAFFSKAIWPAWYSSCWTIPLNM